jgi:hypothetical protein
MKTRLAIQVLLIVCFSCGTNKKPVSDSQKEKIKGEVKEVVNTLLKGSENVNFDMSVGIWYDSPDFIYQLNGETFTYKEFENHSRTFFSELLNQKHTDIHETYTIIDNSNVLLTIKDNVLVNFKDGHSVMSDPSSGLWVFKKIGNKWRVIYGSESGVEKIVKASEAPKEFNQIELHQQFVGNWKGEVAKDTTCFWDVKPFGTGYECYSKYVSKGKIVSEVKSLWGYNTDLDKYLNAEMIKGMDNNFYSTWFTTKNICLMIPYSDMNNKDNAALKWTVEFKSSDEFVFTTVLNNKPAKVDTFKRVK